MDAAKGHILTMIKKRNAFVLWHFIIANFQFH